MSILSNKPDKQDKVLKEIEAIAKGTIPHIKPTIYTEDEIKELKGEHESFSKNAATSTSSGDICQAIFATANYRDAMYSTRGRKFMRVAGLNGKARAAWGRMECLNWMEKEQ